MPNPIACVLDTHQPTPHANPSKKGGRNTNQFLCKLKAVAGGKSPGKWVARMSDGGSRLSVSSYFVPHTPDAMHLNLAKLCVLAKPNPG